MTSEQQQVLEDRIVPYPKYDRAIRKIGDWIKGNTSSKGNKKTLEVLVDPDKQYDLINQKRASLIPSDILYEQGFWQDPPKNRIYQHYHEELISCCDDKKQISFPLINKESFRKLKDFNYSYVHIGLIAVGIKATHRKHMGTSACVAFLDTSNNRMEQAIMGVMEMDMSECFGLSYIAPDLTMSIEDFYKYIRILVKRKGYDMVDDRQNLIVTLGLVGRLSNEMNSRYTVQVPKVLEHLTSKGVKALDASTVEPSIRTDWNIVHPQEETLVPSRVSYYAEQNGSLTMKFGDYNKKNMSLTEEEDEYTLEDLERNRKNQQEVFNMVKFVEEPSLDPETQEWIDTNYPLYNWKNYPWNEPPSLNDVQFHIESCLENPYELTKHQQISFLIVTLGLVGRLSNEMNSRYTVHEFDHVKDFLLIFPISF